MTGKARYRVGCAGMFERGQDFVIHGEDEAIVACETVPGCEIYDTVNKQWIGPASWAEITEAKARLARDSGDK